MAGKKAGNLNKTTIAELANDKAAVYKMAGDNRDLSAINDCFKRANRGFDRAEIEARAASDLSALPGVVPVLDFGSDGAGGTLGVIELGTPDAVPPRHPRADHLEEVELGGDLKETAGIVHICV